MKELGCWVWPRLTVCVVSLTCALVANADRSPSSTPLVPMTHSQSKPANGKSHPANLGKVNVTAMRQLVKTLQVVKVALNAPYSSDSSKANVVVCRIRNGHGYLNVQERMGAVLECGTNSWFTWAREACHIGGLGACASMGTLAAAYKPKGAWHSRRALNLQQVMALRKLLKELPPPGKGDVIVVNNNGKAVMTLQAADGGVKH